MVNEKRKVAPADESPAIDYGYIGRSYLILPGEGNEKIKNDSLGIVNIEKAIQLGDTTFNYYQDLSSNFIKNKNWQYVFVIPQGMVQGCIVFES